MSDKFQEGFEYAQNALAGAVGISTSQAYLNEINQNVQNMVDDMIATAGSKNLDTPQLQGFINEIWHTHTFNTNATIHHSGSMAIQPDVNTYGSADVVVKTAGKEIDYSLKSYFDGKASAKAMAESPWERYNASKAKENGVSFDEFLAKRGIKAEDANMSMYVGQGKLIPSDQLERAKEYLSKKIESIRNNAESNTERLARAEGYQEVLDTLTGKITDGKTESLELTHEQAIKLAKAAAKGNIDKELLEECGIDVKQMVSAKDITQEALKGGLTAAAMSAIITMAPVVVNAISKLIAEGEIDVDDLKRGGIRALKSSAKSFVLGSVTSAVKLCCELGKWGPAFAQADPTHISLLVSITVSTLEIAFNCTSGKIDRGEMARQLMRMYVTTAFSFAGGTALTIVCEGFAPAYFIGSLIGSIIGGLVYSATENLFISFCIESGCTFFGLVEQNYELPQEVIDALGLEVFEYDKFVADEFEFEKFQPETFSYNQFQYEEFGIKPLKRGLIGVYSIGYV